MRAETITADKISLAKRNSESHKGQNGKVFAVGGSIEYVGAIVLAGMAAFRSGADLVVVAAPEKIAIAINFWPDFITSKYSGKRFGLKHAPKIIKESQNYDVLLVGNGISKNPSSLKFARKVIAGHKGSKIIDADAIHAIRLKDVENSILTPHKGEFDALLENSGIKEKTLENKIIAAQKIISTNVILLKGKEDFIFSNDRVAINKTGNPGMTKGGTGDVLAGVCAGLVAQGNPLFESACAAAYINGYAGDQLYEIMGYGFTATDLVDQVARVIKKWQ